MNSPITSSRLRRHCQPLFLITALLTLTAPQYLTAQATAAQLESIVRMVEAGKMIEARVKVDTLLEVYPDDRELKEMATMLTANMEASPLPSPSEQALDRIRASLSGSTATPIAPTPATPIAPVGLSQIDRLEIQTALLGAEQALKTGDIEERNKRLRELLGRSVPDSARSSTSAEWLPYWQTRAVAALTIDDLRSGWQAAQALRRLDALSTNDAALSQVMANLNLKGWLTMDTQRYEETLQRDATLQRRHTAWAGVHTYTTSSGSANSSVGSNDTKKLTLSTSTPPRFIEWANNNSRYSSVSTSRYHDIIPGETASFHASDSTGWSDNLLSRTQNELTDATFDNDYLTLTVSYKNSQYGMMRRTFRLIESANPPHIQDEANNIYSKIK